MLVSIGSTIILYWTITLDGLTITNQETPVEILFSSINQSLHEGVYTCEATLVIGGIPMLRNGTKYHTLKSPGKLSEQYNYILIYHFRQSWNITF